ncbi:MAG TPA: hypothetical protein VJZ91_03950 [Blastocatellia bacterium]|nr:hypothetical protein [Blastocatellia bacterium]
MDSLKTWHDYFLRNRAGGAINWDAPDGLTREEKARIGKSVAAFQLGEYSEGKGLMKAATAFAQKHGCPDLIPITRLFIGEEQRHALLLKRFMDRHGIAPLKKNWADAVFRRLRKNVGFEPSVSVLITAEIISLVYYRALRRGTGSDLLRQICDKILADEMAHTEYESALLNHLRRRRPAAARKLIVWLHQFLLLGTIAAVYWGHKAVLNRGGYNFSRFFAACWLEFSDRFVPAIVVRATANLYQPDYSEAAGKK